MKIKTIHYISLLCTIFLATGCSWFRTVTYYEPEYLSFDALRKTISTEEPRQIIQTGKIYVAGNYIFANEYHEGVHIIDMSDPEAPLPVAFVPIPGNVDVAVRGTTLYADSYVDLVALDISDPLNVTEVGRLTDVFPHRLWRPWFELEWSFDSEYADADPEEGIVIGWTEVSRKIEFANTREYLYSDVAMEAGAGDGSSTGTGGSMARFTIVGTYLYALHDGYVELFDISTPEEPAKWTKIDLSWDIETIFPYQDKLFIGSMTGMYIFDNSNPANPVELSEFSHARSCDPVVATDTRAYVTLRSGTVCGGGSDELNVIDISDIKSPVLLKTYGMWEPYGLGIEGDTLFICDGPAGLKIYNAADDMNHVLLKWFKDIESFDVIPLGGIAIVVGKGGLYLFDYSDTENISLLSNIAITGSH